MAPVMAWGASGGGRRTALDRYIRLEALGQWRPAPDAEAREVVVSFGRSTLVLAELDETPLGHWALAGIRVIAGEGSDGATTYAMTPEGYETLAIRDVQMNEAIGAVTAAARGFPAAVRRRRTPRWALAAAVVAAPGIGLWAGAPLLHAQAARMLPPEAATRFGGEMLIHIIGEHGAPCADPAAAAVLARLAERVAGTAAPQVRLIDLGPRPVAVLPGDLVLLDRDLVTHADAPEELAGWIALGLEAEAHRPAARRLMQAAGTLPTLGFLISGRLGDRALARAAAAAVPPPGHAAPNLVPEPAEPSGAMPPEMVRGLARRLAGADLPAWPIAQGLRRAGAPAAADALLAQPTAPAEGRAVLSDEEWAVLRASCAP